MGDINIKISPVQLVDYVVVEAKFRESCVVNFSNGDGCEVEIG